jgi:hypothetical protein
MVRLLGPVAAYACESDRTVGIRTWGHVAASYGPDPHNLGYKPWVPSLGSVLPEQLLSNDSFEPLGYKLKGYSGMAEVEHLGGLCVYA